jgi:hypothetical protein
VVSEFNVPLDYHWYPKVDFVLVLSPEIRQDAAMKSPEVIVSVGAEGGSITLFGLKDLQNNWKFARGVDDQTPTLLTREDGGGPAINHESGWVSTWPEAMALLDRYPWAMLSGREVHPEFRERVWVEVNQRLQAKDAHSDSARERWARACRAKIGGALRDRS